MGIIPLLWKGKVSQTRSLGESERTQLSCALTIRQCFLLGRSKVGPGNPATKFSSIELAEALPFPVPRSLAQDSSGLFKPLKLWTLHESDNLCKKRSSRRPPIPGEGCPQLQAG